MPCGDVPLGRRLFYDVLTRQACLKPYAVGAKLAERRGFEPLVPSRAHLISNQEPSATRTSLHLAN